MGFFRWVRSGNEPTGRSVCRGRQRRLVGLGLRAEMNGKEVNKGVRSMNLRFTEAQLQQSRTTINDSQVVCHRLPGLTLGYGDGIQCRASDE